jgi:predicted RNA binding protein YcfA (HicA-like mRNA interferase family)
VNKRKLLAKVRNNPWNVRFADLVLLAEAHGFELDRQSGSSHSIFKHPAARALLNLRPHDDGEAKSYPVREFLSMVDEYGLTMGEDQ